MDGRSSDSGTFTATPRVALALGALVSAATQIEAVRRSDLAAGDRLLVSTRNSIYSLELRADGRFDVSGGWYSRHAESGAEGHTLAVSGCTAGGHALFTSIVAAPGLFLEFGDGTRTTRIRRVRRIAAAGDPTAADIQ
jgi:hypothetical protein